MGRGTDSHLEKIFRSASSRRRKFKDTADRVIPYFEKVIEPVLNEKKNVLICAHGNSLRALVMHIEKISPEEIVKIEIATGEPIFYKFQNKEFFRT